MEKKTWSAAFARIENEKIKVSTADKDDQPFAGVKRGDTILRVIAGGRAEALLYFILRRENDGMLFVHLEATDY